MLVATDSSRKASTASRGSFLQRAYDMLIHDVAIDKLHVVLGVDRAGLVGEDGETHHGVFDVAFLDSVPGMTVLAPSSYAELSGMLEQAVLHVDGPVAIRYPRGGEGAYQGDAGPGHAAVLRQGDDITLVSYGILINDVLEAAELLAAEGVQAEVVKLNVITPLDPELVLESVKKTKVLLTVEDSAAHSSVGERLAAAVAEAGLRAKVLCRTSGDKFVTHGALSCLKQELGLDSAGIFRAALEEVRKHG